MPEDLNHLVPGDDDQEPVNPQSSAELGREIRFGVTLIGLLLAILGIAVYVKLGSPGLSSLPWGKHDVVKNEAPPDEQAAAAEAPVKNPFERDSAAPTPIVAVAPDDQSYAADPSASAMPAADDRYAGYNLGTPPAEPPMPIGAAGEAAALAAQAAYEEIPPAADSQSPAAYGIPTETDTAAQPDWASTEAPAFDPTRPTRGVSEGQIEQVGAAEPTPFALPSDDADLPGEPPADIPLVPSSELELQAPQQPLSDVQPTAAREPSLAEPRNSPYGRPAAQDRYANSDRYAAGVHTAPHNGYVEQGPRAAPSAEHTPYSAPTHSPNAARPADPFNSQLERELQNSRTPHYGQAPPPSALDAPVSEFAAPQDSISGHHHAPPHAPTHVPEHMPEPVPVTNGTYEVMPNDSFWTISQKVYGTSGYFKAIQRHNRKPGDQADGLEIGEKILVPPVEVLEQKYPQLCPKRRPPANQTGRLTSAHPVSHGGRVYVVEEGDTLFDIARYELGKASRWAEIYELNKHHLGGDYDYVAPGTRLILPDTASVHNDPEPIAERPFAPFK